MRKLFLLPFVSLSFKFLARIAMSTLWGVLLSDFDSGPRLGFGAALAVVAVFCSYSMVAWDRMPITASRLALYGLVVAGEAMAVGAVVLAFLGAYTGTVNMPALWMCAFSAPVLSVYSIRTILRDNMSQRPGSNQ